MRATAAQSNLAALIFGSIVKQPNRHCERSEAIHAATQRRMDCFVALLLAMTSRYNFAIPPHVLREFCPERSAPLGDQRAQGIPGAPGTRSLACESKKAHELVTTVTPGSPGIPRAMVYSL
jgi:hypothetical protein